MAYEAMNNAARPPSRLIVILNDNDMSIAPPVGGMSAYLAAPGLRRRLPLVPRARQAARRPAAASRSRQRARKAEEYARGMVTGGTFFEELGFYYVGPIDGHNLDHLVPVLQERPRSPSEPVLVHVVTQKGKGYAPAENAADKYHGVVKFDVVTGAAGQGASPTRPATPRCSPRS